MRCIVQETHFHPPPKGCCCPRRGWVVTLCGREVEVMADTAGTLEPGDIFEGAAPYEGDCQKCREVSGGDPFRV